MVSAQRHLPSALPSPPALYPILRRLSSQCLGRFGDRRTARRLLCWMLLGVDDVVVRWWRDERVMDRSYCDARTRGENRRRAPRVERSRRCSYRRRLVTDATYVRYRSFADFRANVRYGSLADISERIRDVRFTPESGHADRQHRRPLSANSGQSANSPCCTIRRSFARSE